MRKDDEICLKHLIRAVAELNKNYKTLNALRDEYLEAGLSPLLDAIGHLLLSSHDIMIRTFDITVGLVYGNWEDSEKVDIYFKELIAITDIVKRNQASKLIKKGELLLLDYRLEMV
jgi:hypothetical protein